MPRALLVLACTLFAAVAAGCSIQLDAEKITHTDEHRFRVTGRPAVALSTFDGSIQVDAWDQPDVLVTIRKSAGDLETARALPVRVSQEGNRIVVEVPQPEGTGGIGINVGRSAALEVKLPAGADIEARTGDGSIAVSGVSGRVEARSGDGAISGHRLQGDIVAATGDGSLTLEDVNGRLDVHSGDGSIAVAGILERLRAHSGDGSVTVRALQGSRVVEVWDISTGDGSVTLELPPALDAELDAHTGDGQVSVEGVTAAEGTRAERAFKGRIGAGGPALKIRSGDGSITVLGARGSGQS